MTANPIRTTLKLVDDNLEKVIVLVAYTACAGIIAIEVFRRFFFGEQVPWSTTIPAYMFLWLTWPGAAYGVKIRAHLAFTELRKRLPKWAQYMTLQIDYLLFIGFGVVAVYYSYDFLNVQMFHGSVVPGTLTLPAWWFYLATPVGWLLVIFRVLQNALEDYRAIRDGQPLNLGGGIAAIK